ncbi:uncharacterized protein LOC144199120 isoform X2 [Stigmatopora nigra]
MFNRRGQSQSSSSRCQTPKWRMPLHGRALLSCSELTICRRKSLNEHRLLGNIKNVAKTTRKEQLEDAITKIPPKGDKLMCPQRFFKIKESTKGDLVSAYEQIASGTPTYEVFQNKSFPEFHQRVEKIQFFTMLEHQREPIYEVFQNKSFPEFHQRVEKIRFFTML